jgi:hypothetical protein
MKIYNVNRRSNDEYIAGLDSSWETIDLAYKAADLQNKYYSSILKAEVYEMQLMGAGDWNEYERNIINSKYKSPNKSRIKQQENPEGLVEKVL